MKLKEIQKTLVDFIYHDAQISKLVDKITAYDAQEVLLATKIHTHITLRNVLKYTYKSVLLLMSERRFEKLTAEYIATHPSTHGTLNMYGKKFPVLLSGYLKEMAILDLAFDEVSEATSFTKINKEEFSKIGYRDYESVIFIPNPTIQILQLQYNILNFWKILRKTREAFRFRATKRNTHVAIFRTSKHHISATTLTDEECIFIQGCKKINAS